MFHIYNSMNKNHYVLLVLSNIDLQTTQGHRKIYYYRNKTLFLVLSLSVGLYIKKNYNYGHKC